MRWRDTPQGRLATEANELSAKGDPAGALDLLDRALEIRPRDPIVLVYRGRVLIASGRHDEAEQSLRTALGIDGNLSHAWNELGMLMESRGKFEKAAHCYEESARMAPCAEILTMLASMQLAFDPQKAIESAKRTLSLDSDWSEAQTVLDAAEKETRRQAGG